jgi:hypothetical protein
VSANQDAAPAPANRSAVSTTNENAPADDPIAAPDLASVPKRTHGQSKSSNQVPTSGAADIAVAPKKRGRPPKKKDNAPPKAASSKEQKKKKRAVEAPDEGETEGEAAVTAKAPSSSKTPSLKITMRGS